MWQPTVNRAMRTTSARTRSGRRCVGRLRRRRRSSGDRNGSGSRRCQLVLSRSTRRRRKMHIRIFFFDRSILGFILGRDDFDRGSALRVRRRRSLSLIIGSRIAEGRLSLRNRLWAPRSRTGRTSRRGRFVSRWILARWNGRILHRRLRRRDERIGRSIRNRSLSFGTPFSDGSSAITAAAGSFKILRHNAPPRSNVRHICGR